MRSIWSGSLSFGLVNIPIKLYVATEETSFDMDLLHKKDLSPIRFARICKVEEKEVPYSEIIRGVEVQEDDYVVLTDEELQKANVQKTKLIDIKQFVDEKEIDTIYFEKPYYIEPAKGSEKAYALLFQALKRSKKVGVATFVLRTRERVVMIKPYKEVLVLDQLRYSDEIRSTDELKMSQADVSKREVDLALAFISQMTESFKPTEFHDTYTKEIEKLIEAKSKGKTIRKSSTTEPKPTKVNDLMSLLKASLEKQKEESGHPIPMTN